MRAHGAKGLWKCWRREGLHANPVAVPSEQDAKGGVQAQGPSLLPSGAQQGYKESIEDPESEKLSHCGSAQGRSSPSCPGGTSSASVLAHFSGTIAGPLEKSLVHAHKGCGVSSLSIFQTHLNTMLCPVLWDGPAGAGRCHQMPTQLLQPEPSWNSVSSGGT